MDDLRGDGEKDLIGCCCFSSRSSYWDHAPETGASSTSWSKLDEVTVDETNGSKKDLVEGRKESMRCQMWSWSFVIAVIACFLLFFEECHMNWQLFNAKKAQDDAERRADSVMQEIHDLTQQLEIAKRAHQDAEIRADSVRKRNLDLTQQLENALKAQQDAEKRADSVSLKYFDLKDSPPPGVLTMMFSSASGMFKNAFACFGAVLGLCAFVICLLFVYFFCVLCLCALGVLDCTPASDRARRSWEVGVLCPVLSPSVVNL